MRSLKIAYRDNILDVLIAIAEKPCTSARQQTCSSKRSTQIFYTRKDFTHLRNNQTSLIDHKSYSLLVNNMLCNVFLQCIQNTLENVTCYREPHTFITLKSCVIVEECMYVGRISTFMLFAQGNTYTIRKFEYYD